MGCFEKHGGIYEMDEIEFRKAKALEDIASRLGVIHEDLKPLIMTVDRIETDVSP